MALPFSFEGKIGRLPYLLGSVAAFFSQHLAVFIACKALRVTPVIDALFWIAPLRALVVEAKASDAILIAGFAYFLLVAWVLAALAFRRAADANIHEGLAATVTAPLVQIPVVLYLAAAPPRAEQTERDPLFARDANASGNGMSAALGVIAGVGITLVAVALSTLVFRVYGFGVFVLLPFVIGVTTAYIANRKADIGGYATTKVVLGATTLGGIALILASLEGAICILMASPLGAAVAAVGGLLGRALAGTGKRGQVAPGFALLPIVFALEHLFSVPTHFDTQQAITVNAPVEVVWSSILRMDRIDEPLALPFRLGVAYPIRGEVIGEGVGAVRHGEFSTGTAIERVTEWEQHRRLAFVVERDVPAMHELSPYEHVHAPHAVGYFTTGTTRFALAPRADGAVDVTLTTTHEIRLDPILYWMPLARFMVTENNARVLAHIRNQSERNRRAGL
jgi:hypothetical protein